MQKKRPHLHRPMDEQVEHQVGCQAAKVKDCRATHPPKGGMAVDVSIRRCRQKPVKIVTASEYKCYTHQYHTVIKVHVFGCTGCPFCHPHDAKQPQPTP